MKDIIIVLVSLLNKQLYDEWHSFIPTDSLPREIGNVFKALCMYHAQDKGDIDLEDFILWYTTTNPEECSANKMYGSIFDQMRIVSDDDLLNSNPLMKSLADKALAVNVKDLCTDILNGSGSSDNKKSLDRLKETVSRHIDKVHSTFRVDEKAVTLTTEIVQSTADNAYPWRLKALNDYVGWYSNHLIIWGAMPDGGKTAALICQADFQAEFLQVNGDDDGIILYMTNEQGDLPMQRRLKSCALGEAESIWNTWTSDMVRDRLVSKYGNPDRVLLFDVAGLGTSGIEKILSHYEGKVRGIYLDQLHKVKHKDSSGIEKLGYLFEWARDMSKSVSPVQTVHQVSTVSPTGWKVEGGTYLEMDAFYGSKTYIQGEGDVIITMNLPSKDDFLNLRYCKVAKTKVYGFDHDPDKAQGARQFYCTINKQLSRLENVGV